MIQKNPLAEPGGGMNVGLEHIGRPTLEIQREIPFSRQPQPMGQTMGLDGMEAFKIQKRLDEPLAGRVAFDHRRDIDPQGIDDIGIGFTGAIEGIDDNPQPDHIVFKPSGNTMKNRRLERRLVQNGIDEQGGQHRRALIGLFRFQSQLGPQCVGQGLLIVSIHRGPPGHQCQSSHDRSQHLPCSPAV